MGHCGLVAVAVLCVFLIQDGWAQTDRRQANRDKHRRRLAELSRSTSSFGVALYRQLAAGSNDNLIFSPLSVYTALSMTMIGSKGQTKKQLKSVLSLRRDQAVHRTLHALFASFPTSRDVNVTLRMANALYYDDTKVTLADRFTRSIRQSYGGAAQPFQRPDPENAINDWVNRHTGGMIPDFLQPGQVTPDMALMLLNAVYFQGTWENIFDEQSTRDRDFTTGSGSRVRVPMMSRDGEYSVKQDVAGLDARVLELPYREGRFSLYIILPNSGLREVEGALSSQVLEDALSDMPAPMRYEVTVPKFSMRMRTTLNDYLKAMGLTMLFEERFADLTRMAQSSQGNLYVSQVRQEAVIEVNERGTQASAVTSVGISIISLPPQFIVDRPFLVVLRDKRAQLNIFLGRVVDPSRW